MQTSGLRPDHGPSLCSELGQALQALPPFAFIYRLYMDVIKVKIEDRCTLLRQRGRAIIFFFPDRYAIGLDPSLAERMGQTLAKRA